MTDIIIIGGGPAGLTAAIYGKRANKSVIVIEKGSFGGQINFSPKIENYTGFASAAGNELASAFVEHAIAQNVNLVPDSVLSLSRNEYTFTVFCENDIYEAKTVIIASGAKHRTLGVPGEERFEGKGISFCAVCDGAFYKDKDVIVVGGGNSALQETILLAEVCKKVTVVQNLDYFTGEKKLVEHVKALKNAVLITGAVVKEFTGGDALTGVIIKKEADGSEAELKTDGVFIAVGLMPENQPFEDAVKLDNNGYIIAGEDTKTSTPGIFAAGDCRTKSVRQIATAAADGAAAALAAAAYIDGRA